MDQGIPKFAIYNEEIFRAFLKKKYPEKRKIENACLSTKFVLRWKKKTIFFGLILN